jgi:hypothetical protein
MLVIRDLGSLFFVIFKSSTADKKVCNYLVM